MDILDCIQDNMLIICDNTYKMSILKEINKKHLFLDVKFYTKNEFLNNFLFQVKDEGLYYLVSTYHLKVEIAKMYLKNLYYIEEAKEYKSNKLKFLQKIKKELQDNNLIIYNHNFKDYLSKFQIMVVGYPYLDNYELKIFKEINAYIYDVKESNKLTKVYELDSMEDEINFVCKQIASLIEKGINVNNIKLMNVSKEYYNDLRRIFKFYNIPIRIPTNNNLYCHNVTKIFLENFSSDLSESIEKIKNYDKKIVNKIINICNKYSFLEDKLKGKDLIIYDLKNTTIEDSHLKNYVELINLFDYVSNDDYVFLMNFNTTAIPKIYKDEEYITDNIKDEIDAKTTITINKEVKNYTKNILSSINNLVITYKLKDYKTKYFKSPLVDELSLDIIKPEISITTSYSVINDKINYAKLEDLYVKYNHLDPLYYIYQNTYGNNGYKSYDNSFKGINKDSLKEYLNNKLTLSYSALNNYNRCAFRYYIENILRLNEFTESFEAFIGSIFHYVLENTLNNNSNVEDEINTYIKNKNKILTSKEAFFVKKITEDIKYAVNVIRMQKEYISLDKELYEQDIVIHKSKDMVINFKGFIDKIMYKENNGETLISIIDYKTGDVDIDLKGVPYGLGMQLPIYLYLVSKSGLFKNPKFVGFYLQHILDTLVNISDKKTYDELKQDKLKLLGYSTNQINYLSYFDNSYEKSNLIKSMSVKKDGDFNKNAKVLSDDEINKLISLTEENIDKCIDSILKGDFSINPKRIGYDKDVGCEYCKFKDLCFKKNEDYITLEEVKDLHFLRGEDND